MKNSERRARWLPLVALVMLAGCARLAAAPSGAGSGAATDTGLGTATEPSVFKDYADGSPAYTPIGELPVGGIPCAKTFSVDRCDALAIAASEALAVPFERVGSILIVPNPSPVDIDFAHRTFLEVTLDDGTSHSVVISCPGIAGAVDPQCMWDPTVPLGMPNGLDHGGYSDRPDGSTPFPSLEPAAVADSRALRVPRLVIPITGVGQRTIVIGSAALPNGLLREGAFALSDQWPLDVHFSYGPTLVVRPVGGGPELMNLYEHGWRSGVEEVEVTLTFSVTWFKPGASITVVNLVVR